MCFSRSENTTRLNSISTKRLSSQLKLATEKEKERVVQTYISAVFKSLGEYHKAKEYIHKALVITTEIGDRKGQGECYVKLATVFQSFGQ